MKKSYQLNLLHWKFEIGNWKFPKGYTVVELLLYMGLLSILLVVLLQIFTELIDLQLDTHDTSVVEQDSKFLLSRLLYDIHRADSVTTPGSLGANIDTLQLNIGSVQYVYQLQNGNIYLVATDSSQLNSIDTTVSNLSFTRVGNDTGKHQIRVSYTITSKHTQNPDTKTVSTTIGLR